jgi:ribosomal protein S18 acetylase RimI-like enzyme
VTPVIREATREDAPLLAAVIRDSFRDVASRFDLTPDNCPTHPSNCVPEWVESATAKGMRYFVLESGGEPVGCVALEQAGPDICRLEWLAVLPKHRRHGFGDALVRHVLHEARRMGAATVKLAIIADHSELKAWYEQRGFAVTGSQRFDHLPFEVAFMQTRV